MKLTVEQRRMIASYLRSLLASALATYTATGDIKATLNALWAAVIPTAMRYLNPKDPGFGRKAE